MRRSLRETYAQNVISKELQYNKSMEDNSNWNEVETVGEPNPQFQRSRHGSLYDRGRADAWYKRPFDPHWYPNGTYNEPRIDKLTSEEINEYDRGYRYMQHALDTEERDAAVERDRAKS